VEVPHERQALESRGRFETDGYGRAISFGKIARELGRGLNATIVKAHQLRISLRVRRKLGSLPAVDPGPAGMDLPKGGQLKSAVGCLTALLSA
jgi:hypothetical protein